MRQFTIFEITSSYYPWRQIIRQAVDVHEDDSPAEVRHKLRFVCECCNLPGGDIPFLEAMLAVESEESAKVVMGFQGDALNQQMINAVCGNVDNDILTSIYSQLGSVCELSGQYDRALETYMDMQSTP